MSKTIFIISILSFVLFSCNRETPSSSTNNDISIIEQTMKEYRNAWMEGDSTAVLHKISSDVILFLPGKTAKPVIGKKAIKEFWFPESDISYPILEYKISNHETKSSGNIAYYQGISKLIWYTKENTIARDTITSISEFTTILKKQNEEWKIHRLMYTLKDENYTW